MENEIDFIMYQNLVETSLSADEVLHVYLNVDRGGTYVRSAFSLIG